MTTTMEQRYCHRPGCPKTFKVLASSPQTFCSTYCEEETSPKPGNNKWRSKNGAHYAEQKERFRKGIPQMLMNEGKNKRVSATGGFMQPIQSSEKSRTLDTKNGIGKTESQSQEGPHNTIERIENGIVPLDEHNAKKPAPSIELLDSSDLVKSTSMNLIDDSANHLLGLMKGLHANAPPAEAKSYDPDRVRAACDCADQIHKMMRLKFDVIKTFRQK